MDSNGVLRDRVKTMVVECARLKIAPADIRDDQALFDPAGGIGLDSIDVLELVVGLERTFGVQIQDGETGKRVLASVDSICDFIRQSGKA